MMLRTTNPDLTDGYRAVLQNALANLYALETAVERGIANAASLKSAKFNAVVPHDLDQLIAVLVELKAKNIRG